MTSQSKKTDCSEKDQPVFCFHIHTNTLSTIKTENYQHIAKLLTKKAQEMGDAHAAGLRYAEKQLALAPADFQDWFRKRYAM